jgi:Ca-activated chloride channel family protein
MDRLTLNRITRFRAGGTRPMRKIAVVFALCLVFLFQQISTVFADGIIIPEPPICALDGCPGPIPYDPMIQLEIVYHHVTVTIEDQLATVHVDQEFYNPNDYEVEGQYIFPIPVDASVDDFVLWMNNEPVKGKVLDAEEARETYESIVNQMKDPALLEYLGQGAVQAQIYPIPAGDKRRIELEYTQVLAADNGLVDFVYPLNTEKFSLQPLQDVSIEVNISSSQPQRAIYSPSHAVQVDKKNDKNAQVTYQEENVLPDQDFELIYSLGSQQAVHLLSYLDTTDEEDGDGYFLLLLAPPIASDQPAVEKDIVLILDRSGSMEGEKFQQAQEAAKSILERLNENDRFYLSTFSDRIMTFSSTMDRVSQTEDAKDWIDRQSAAGSTDINLALLDAIAMVDNKRPTYIIFLTDGLPTAGEVDRDAILRNIAQEMPDNVRLFSFGVGYDVDTSLLDSLSQENHGSSTYVKPEMPLDEVLSGFYEKISSPVLTNLSLDFGSLNIYDVYPTPLPDLFAGNQVIVTGRYKKGGQVDLTLSGEVNGQREAMKYRDLAFSKGSTQSKRQFDSLPRIWATRKVGYLLREIRLQGMNEELIQQVIKLSVRYGIVTPYTSYLVEEPQVLGFENQQSLANDAMKSYETMPSAEVSGFGAVERAVDEGVMSAAESAPQTAQDVQQMVKMVGNRTFLWQEDQWVDTLYDEASMPLHKIPFLSQAYYDLLNAYPDVQKSLAVGDRLIVVINGEAYQIVEPGAKASYEPNTSSGEEAQGANEAGNPLLQPLSCLSGISLLGVAAIILSFR